MSLFGERVRKRRNEIGMTLEELSRKVGVGRSNLGHIERGRNSTSVEVATKIADALRVSTDYLNGNTDDPRPLSDVQYMDFESSQIRQLTVNESVRHVYDFEKSRTKRLIDEQIRKIKSDPTLSFEDQDILIDQLLGNKIPLLGTICAGDGLLATENVEDRISYPLPGNGQPDYALRVKGDSMIGAGIADGDIVFMRHAVWHDFNGQIVAAIINDQEDGTLKRIKQSPNSTKYLLVPENDNYETLELVPGKDFTICGVYMGHFKPGDQ